MWIRRGALTAAVMLLLAACGSGEEAGGATAVTEPAAAPATEAAAAPVSEPADSTTEAGAPSAAATSAAGATVAVASSDLGDILVDGDGRALYVFDNDAPDTSNCAGDCAETWPPLTGEPEAGDGVEADMLGTIERDDGSTQVTYGGSPLYYFAGDQAPGDVNGQAVGDVWWVVGPDGERITGAAAAANSGGY